MPTGSPTLRHPTRSETRSHDRRFPWFLDRLLTASGRGESLPPFGLTTLKLRHVFDAEKDVSGLF